MPPHPAFNQVSHRPWAPPAKNWHWEQTWLDLLFIHWEIKARNIRRFIPEGLEIDTFDGTAWLSIVPFRMRGVAPRGFPRPSRFCDFPEINVRTYVKRDGKPGVWFFSLDIPNPLFAWLARSLLNIPYNRASMNVEVDSQDCVHFRSQHPDRVFEATYSGGEACPATPGSFEHWATERYCFYAEDFNQRLYRAEVQHPKWPLQTARYDVECNSYLAEFSVGAQHPSVLYATQLPVVAWMPEKI